MSDLQVKTIDAIKKMDEKKLEMVSRYIVFIEKRDSYDIPNNDTIESFIEGEELLKDPNTKYYNNIDELKEAIDIEHRSKIYNG